MAKTRKTAVQAADPEAVQTAQDRPSRAAAPVEILSEVEDGPRQAPGSRKSGKPSRPKCIVVDETTGDVGEEDVPDEEELEAAGEDDAFLAPDADESAAEPEILDAEVADSGEGGRTLSRQLPSTRDSFQVYVSEVSKFPLLQPEEEHALAVHYREHHDADSAFRLISSHLRLVVRIALDFQRRWMQNVLDLVQEGNVGLMHAINKFDPDKGIKFSYYATFWIKAYILKFIMDNFRMVKIGTTQVQRKLFYNLNKERQKLIAQGFNPDSDMLARSLGVNREDVEDMERRMSASDSSLNTPIGDEQGSTTRQDLLPALGPGIEESIASDEISDMLRRRIEQILPELSEKEQYILKYRLLSEEPETLREIGDRYGITRERVRQLEIRLLEKIKQHLSMDIKDFSEEWIQP